MGYSQQDFARLKIPAGRLISVIDSAGSLAQWELLREIGESALPTNYQSMLQRNRFL